VTTPVIVCGFRTEPAEKECLAAVWSQGRECKRCPVECYRRGWSHQNVTIDNAKRVAEKQRSAF